MKDDKHQPRFEQRWFDEHPVPKPLPKCMVLGCRVPPAVRVPDRAGEWWHCSIHAEMEAVIEAARKLAAIRISRYIHSFPDMKITFEESRIE